MERQWLRIVWWSGALGMIALAHLGRAIVGVPVTVGGLFIPRWVSAVIGLVAGAWAAWLYFSADVTIRMAAFQRQLQDDVVAAAARKLRGQPAVSPCGGLHSVVTADQDDNDAELDEAIDPE